jgi:nucleoside 2-deoxyribosyltransferase
MKKPRIYLAGRDSFAMGYEWRSSIVPNMHKVTEEESFDPAFIIECDRFVCTGSFFQGGPHEDRQRVFDLCCARVAMSDCVFAYISDATAFTAMFELGFAYGIEKPMYLGFSDTKIYDECWIAAQRERATFFGTEQECWRRFMEGWKEAGSSFHMRGAA